MAERKMTSRQKRQELRTLSKQHKESVFDMLRIADELLSDPDYVEQFGGESQLMESLEQNEFSLFQGMASLKAMLRAYRENPKRTTWEDYSYNVQAMIELAKPAKEGETKERINWKALAKELEAKVVRLESTLEQYEQTNSELKTRVDELLSENGELRGQIKQLEKLNRNGALV